MRRFEQVLASEYNQPNMSHVCLFLVFSHLQRVRRKLQLLTRRLITRTQRKHNMGREGKLCVRGKHIDFSYDTTTLHFFLRNDAVFAVAV